MSESLQRIESGPPAPTGAAALLDVISRAAKDPAVDVDKMEKLLVMQERVLAKESEMYYHSKMKDVQAIIPRIRKDARNPLTNSSYTRLETLNATVMPIITSHGFSLSFGTADCPMPDCIRVTCVVANSGHKEHYQVDVPIDVLGIKGNASKTKTHGFGSALTYGRRYLTMLIFNVSDSERDDDGNAASKKQDGVADVQKLKAELWHLLEPVRGPLKDWTQARQWLVDEMCLDPDIPVQDLDAQGFQATITAAKKKLSK